MIPYSKVKTIVAIEMFVVLIMGDRSIDILSDEGPVKVSWVEFIPQMPVYIVDNHEQKEEDKMINMDGHDKKKQDIYAYFYKCFQRMKRVGCPG